MITIRLDSGLQQRIKDCAYRERESMNAWIVKWLSALVESHEEADRTADEQTLTVTQSIQARSIRHLSGQGNVRPPL